MNREKTKHSKKILTFGLTLVFMFFLNFAIVGLLNLIFGITLGFEVFIFAMFLPLQFALTNFFLKEENNDTKQPEDEKFLEVRYDEHGNHDPDGLYNETDIYQLVHTERMFEELEK